MAFSCPCSRFSDVALSACTHDERLLVRFRTERVGGVPCLYCHDPSRRASQDRFHRERCLMQLPGSVRISPKRPRCLVARECHGPSTRMARRRTCTCSTSRRPTLMSSKGLRRLRRYAVSWKEKKAVSRPNTLATVHGIDGWAWWGSFSTGMLTQLVPYSFESTFVWRRGASVGSGCVEEAAYSAERATRALCTPEAVVPSSLVVFRPRWEGILSRCPRGKG